MCNQCHDSKREHGAAVHGRREFLVAGAALATAPLMAHAATGVRVAQTDAPAGNGPFSVRAYGATSATSPLGPLQIQRRAVGPNDVSLDVLYCAICHTDIHYARNDWGATRYPCVPGHEIVGRVAAVGRAVTKFKVGDIAGVGTVVDSDRTCENCLADREQNCLSGVTFTYNSPDRVSGGHTFGGYSDKIVVAEHFVIRIPPGADLPATSRKSRITSRGRWIMA
jgi:uncharacterized zinc-type alcohol dehydrogenase-like protein